MSENLLDSFGRQEAGLIRPPKYVDKYRKMLGGLLSFANRLYDRYADFRTPFDGTASDRKNLMDESYAADALLDWFQNGKLGIAPEIEALPEEEGWVTEIPEGHHFSPFEMAKFMQELKGINGRMRYLNSIPPVWPAYDKAIIEFNELNDALARRLMEGPESYDMTPEEAIHYFGQQIVMDPLVGYNPGDFIPSYDWNHRPYYGE